MADELWSSELAAEFGLPDGWYVYRHQRHVRRAGGYTTRFRKGLRGKVLFTAKEVEGVLGYKPQFPKPRYKPEWHCATEYGLPEGWQFYEYSKPGGKSVMRWRNGPDSKVIISIAALERELGYLPDTVGNLLKRGRIRVGSFNIGVHQNMLAKREFTLLVKPPGQGQGFAGKGARTFTVPTTLGANLREAVADAYQKDQGKRPERGFWLLGPKQVTSGLCITVKDFVAKCGALDGDFMECCMVHDESNRSRRLRLLHQRKAKRLWGLRQRESIMKQPGTTKRPHTKCLWEVQKKPRLGIRPEQTSSNPTDLLVLPSLTVDGKIRQPCHNDMVQTLYERAS